MNGDVIDHPQDKSKNQRREGGNGLVSLCLGFCGNSCQGMEIRQYSGVEDQQNTVHIAKTLVVLVNKLTLRAPFHAISLEDWVDGALRKVEAGVSALRRVPEYTVLDRICKIFQDYKMSPANPVNPVYKYLSLRTPRWCATCPAVM